MVPKVRDHTGADQPATAEDDIRQGTVRISGPSRRSGAPTLKR
jgi:hypothetical protein